MRVLVTGDVVNDHYVYEGQPRRPGSTVLEGAKWISDLGGAALVGRLLQQVAALRPDGAEAATTPRFSVDFGFVDAPRGRDAFCVMQRCDRWRGERERGSVWRIGHALGYSAGEPLIDPQAVRADALDGYADIVVLDDAGLGFRRWPSRHAWPKFLREPQDLPQWIVVKMSGAADSGDLWHTIVSEHTQPEGTSDSAPPTYLGPIAARTVLLLSIDELRRESARVDGWLSWERAAADLIQDLETNPRLEALKKVRFVVVRFGVDGALLVDRSGDTEQHTLVFDPAGIEGAFLSDVPAGMMFGQQSCLAAAIVSRLTDACGTTPGLSAADRIISGIKAGLSGIRRLVLEGHHPDQPATTFPFSQVAGEIHRSTSSWTFGSVALPAGLNRSTTWTIIARTEAHPPAPLWGLARRVATHGLGQLAGTPYLQFAKLFSVDRSEIESFRTLQRLLTRYRQEGRSLKPLSIAAFGPPGSGKSFGVKQLAEALFGDKHPLEFNLAQFSTPGELHGLFHQVRDRVLQGQLPIVFWDEFDSRDLFWLQYLIGPMQDGTFQEGQVTHPIGRCVFVFAGGTRYRFSDFGKPPDKLLETNEEREIQKWCDDFKAKKGPDFQSRLVGYIDVLGPNRRDGKDITFPVRRALLLRVHLGLSPSAPAAIDSGLLNAFLRIEKYRHGARSLEKIAEQVRLSARSDAFNRSDLPPRQLIDLHVNADEFLGIVESM